MTTEEIRKRLDTLDAWVAQIAVSTDQLHDLVLRIAIAGEEADKRIAESGEQIKELAAAQTRTEQTLQKFISSQTRTNGKAE